MGKTDRERNNSIQAIVLSRCEAKLLSLGYRQHRRVKPRDQTSQINKSNEAACDLFLPTTAFTVSLRLGSTICDRANSFNWELVRDAEVRPSSRHSTPESAF